MKQICQRGPHKSCFWVQNGDMGFPGSTYRLIFDVLLRCQKIIIFGHLPDGPKNRKNRALERQGPRVHPALSPPAAGLPAGTGQDIAPAAASDVPDARPTRSCHHRHHMQTDLCTFPTSPLGMQAPWSMMPSNPQRRNDRVRRSLIV